MKTFQVIMKSGLTKIIEGDRAKQTEKAIEFQTGNEVTAIFRLDTVLRVEAYDDGSSHEVVFPQAGLKNELMGEGTATLPQSHDPSKTHTHLTRVQAGE